MVVARKELDYLPPQEQQQKKVIKKQKSKKNYRFESIVFGTGLVITLCLCLMLLLRFTTITEVRHRVDSLNSQLAELEMQKQHLKIKVESLSKSKWIEKEAIERLDMQYPLPEQVIYIHVPPTEVAMISSQINSNNEKMLSSGTSSEKVTKNTKRNTSENIIYSVVGKIVGLFRI